MGKWSTYRRRGRAVVEVPPIPPNGLLTSLISYWGLYEASGTRLDSHGSNDLTSNNGVTGAAGPITLASSFASASSQFLSIASNASLQTGDIDWSFSAWVFLQTKPSFPYVASKTNGGSSQEYGFLYYSVPDRMRLEVYQGGGPTIFAVDNTAGGSPPLTTWFHVAWGYLAASNGAWIQLNAGTRSLIIGGTAPVATSGAFRIGALGTGVGTQTAFWNGRISDVAFWKREITTGDVTALYNGGAGLPYSSFN